MHTLAAELSKVLCLLAASFCLWMETAMCWLLLTTSLVLCTGDPERMRSRMTLEVSTGVVVHEAVRRVGCLQMISHV